MSPKSNMTRTSKILLFSFVAIVLMALVAFAGFAFLVSRALSPNEMHTSVREHTQFAVPETTFAIEHSRIGIHPFLAEYDRDVTFIENEQTGVTCPISIDTCGGYPINVYLIRSNDVTVLRLDDAVSEHLLDLENQTVSAITHAKGDAYYGLLTDSSASSGWSMTDGNPDSLEVTIGGKPARLLSELIGDAEQSYIGCITGGTGHLQFLPASELPETKIVHLWDR